MKSRLGFVSNSSSSSFIVARAQVGDANFAAIRKMAAEDWEADITEENANYLCINTSDGFNSDELEHIGITENDYIHFDY